MSTAATPLRRTSRRSVGPNVTAPTGHVEAPVRSTARKTRTVRAESLAVTTGSTVSSENTNITTSSSSSVRETNVSILRSSRSINLGPIVVPLSPEEKAATSREGVKLVGLDEEDVLVPARQAIQEERRKKIESQTYAGLAFEQMQALFVRLCLQPFSVFYLTSLLAVRVDTALLCYGGMVVRGILAILRKHILPILALLLFTLVVVFLASGPSGKSASPSPVVPVPVPSDIKERLSALEGRVTVLESKPSPVIPDLEAFRKEIMGRLSTADTSIEKHSADIKSIMEKLAATAMKTDVASADDSLRSMIKRINETQHAFQEHVAKQLQAVNHNLAANITSAVSNLTNTMRTLNSTLSASVASTNKTLSDRVSHVNQSLTDLLYQLNAQMKLLIQGVNTSMTNDIRLVDTTLRSVIADSAKQAIGECSQRDEGLQNSLNTLSKKITEIGKPAPAPGPGPTPPPPPSTDEIAQELLASHGNAIRDRVLESLKKMNVFASVQDLTKVSTEADGASKQSTANKKLLDNLQTTISETLRDSLKDSSFRSSLVALIKQNNEGCKCAPAATSTARSASTAFIGGKRKDFALASLGARVVSVGCGGSSTDLFSSAVSRFYSLFTTQNNPPENILLRDIVPGNCWCFDGHNGSIVIRTARRVRPQNFTLSHILPEESLLGNVRNSPRNVRVYGMSTYYVQPSDVLLASAEYHGLGGEIEFPSAQTDRAFPFLHLEVLDNHGADHTCVYHLGVHGEAED
eukprot:m.196969 g.196969  ORF g.196969 m.196969 type:complete len:749 (-) comp17656_c0_seq3:1902-4148(-)